MSLHRFDDQTFYPRREDSAPRFIGEGKGRGYNINVAWNTGCVADEDDRQNNQVSELGCHEYKLACEKLLYPIARQFNPDLILVSCGFDAAIHDHLGWSQLCPLMYYEMTRQLLKICPKMVVILEGGYNTDFLGQHASGVVKALNGTQPEDYGELTQADIDADFSSVEEFDSSKAAIFAQIDVEATRNCLTDYWKI